MHRVVGSTLQSLAQTTMLRLWGCAEYGVDVVDVVKEGRIDDLL
jgi:hypothetical protein